MDWYYTIDGAQQGPVQEEDIYRLAREGGLKPSDLVWNQTMGEEWRKASELPSLTAQPHAVQPRPLAVGGAGVTANGDLTAMARGSLEGHWGVAIMVILLYNIIMIAVSAIPYAGIVLPLLLAGPMLVGLYVFYLALARGEDVEVSQMFEGFPRFGTALGVYVLMGIFILLWSLLLIIPGLVATFAYSQAYFIIADDPNVGPLEAIRRSKQMMKGNKWKLFCLHMRFLGWAVVAALTCGIGFLFLAPYVMTSFAHFYEDILAQAPAGSAGDAS